MNYRCSIEIDIESTSSEEAARSAWQLLSSPGAMLPVVHTADEAGALDTIDLQELAEQA